MADTDPTPKTEPVIPVQETQVTPITVVTETPIEAETETVTETPAPAAAADPAATPAEGERKVEKLPDWAQKIIKDNAFEAREAKRAAAAAKAETEALRAAAKPTVPPAATPSDTEAARASAPPGGYKTQADFDAAVQAEANKREMAARTQSSGREFGAKLDEIWTAGVAEYKDQFDTIAENLQAIGILPVVDPQTGAVANDSFMRLVMATDNPAAVLHAYGSDPAKAQALMAMTPEKRAIEIAKMDVAVGKPKPLAQVSKVPKPVETVEGTRQISADPRDDDSDEVWFQKREAQLRAARG